MADLFDFKCEYSQCRHTAKLDHSDLKLQTTKVTEDRAQKQRPFQWTIATCPKCKATQVPSPGTPLYGKGPIVYIAAPRYEIKPG